MRSLFYPKLAAVNIRKQASLYVPFILTSICTVMVFFVLDCIAGNQGLTDLSGAFYVKTLLRLGEIIVGIFAVVFLFYINSFLMKRRKKELGLYSILGLEKRHIGKILFFESLFTSVFSIIIGILAGMLLSKLMFLILLKLIQTEANFQFALNWDSIQFTSVLFGGTFLLTLISNLMAVGKAKPIELLYGGNKGEKEPKARWILALIGVALMGIGYYMAITVVSPVMAMMQLFFAVLLVMAGTYLLFLAGSVALLKILKKNKRFYYHPRHFTAVSGMLYRMKQNATGLANICIFSTGVLLAIATTLSLSIGIEDLIGGMYPHDNMVVLHDADQKQVDELWQICQDSAGENQMTVKNPLIIQFYETATVREGNLLRVEEKEMDYNSSGMSTMMDLDTYKKLVPDAGKLQENEVYVEGFINPFHEETINIRGKEFQVKELGVGEEISKNSNVRATDGYGIVFSNQTILKQVLEETTDSRQSTVIGFGLEGEETREKQKGFYNLINEKIDQFRNENEGYVNFQCKAVDGVELRSMVSGFVFIGVFLGVLFLMATVLIIYYKQISEGFDDQKRYEIMKKVGMGSSEIKRTIKSQILIVFFLPLVLAVIHVGAAFNLMCKLLQIFGLVNQTLYSICTVGTVSVFAIIYIAVFSVTARTYYKIVGQTF